jgi:tetratricopeptide (TPR) repeat protein
VSDYQRAADLGEAGKLEQAWKIIGKMLIEDPNDVRALVTGSYIMRRLGALPQAYHFALSATRLWPNDDAAWTNLGHAASEMWLVEESEACYKRALAHAKDPGHIKTLWLNLSALYLDNGRFAEAEALTRKILAKDPNHKNAQANLGFCQLATGKWNEGWKGYRNTIGSDWRPRVQYGDEPEWNGEAGKTVVVYGDQGIGDELLFASMLPDAQAICKKLIFDCDDRLEKLFKRSFPGVKIYGTRRAKDGQWDRTDWGIDASLPIGQLGEYFRTSAESFAKQPFLVPDPDRVQMWKALFASKKKPVIGIAWTGGIPKTGMRYRNCTLDAWLPLFKAVDAHYVCLQYKSASAEIAEFKKKHSVDLVEYPYATLTPDYDDTAAMVAALDVVIGVPTSVIHLAGAIGTPTVAMKSKSPCWKYAAGIPFHQCTLIEHKEDWTSTIASAIPTVQKLCGVSSSELMSGNPSLIASSVTRLLNTHRSRFQSPLSA